MQYVNDDMDELFRRAAENYPLDTGNANWNKVWAALQHPEEQPVEKPDRKRRFFWLFALLPLTAVGYYFLQHSPAAQKETVAHQKTTLPSSLGKEQASTHLLVPSLQPDQSGASSSVLHVQVEPSIGKSFNANSSRHN